MKNKIKIEAKNDSVYLYQENEISNYIIINGENINGEMIEDIVTKIGLDSQIFRQLFFKQTDEFIKKLLNEKKIMYNRCKFGFYTCANKIESFCETCEDGDNYELNYNKK